MNWIDGIVDAVNRCPEYIGKGIVQLLVLTLGGVIVAWITTRVFGRKAEVNAVEGTLLKRKLDIYEELSGKLELLKDMVAIPSDLYEAAVVTLRNEGVAFNAINANQVLGIFDSPAKLSETFLSLDKYIVSKKLYYDNDVMLQTMRFQNYFAAFRRLLVVFEEQFVDAGIALDKKEVAAAERLLTIELGLMLQDEFLDRMDKVTVSMKQSFKTPDFKHRDATQYNYDFFMSPDGPILKELLETRLFSEREAVMRLVTKAAALGMAGSHRARKRK